MLKSTKCTNKGKPARRKAEASFLEHLHGLKQISFTQADYYRILSHSRCFVDLKLDAVITKTHARLTVCGPIKCATYTQRKK
jgi:hypothetical protein